MIEQITKNIKISVKTNYVGIVPHEHMSYHAFSYFITIKNNSKETVQLLERHWDIYDSLKESESIEGPGVVGQTPTLEPNEEYSYTSNCFLTSTIGSMNGYYKMISKETSKEFLVTIPSFQLTSTPTLN